MKKFEIGDPVYLQKLHDDILVIMDEIHRLCELNGIMYYMTDGTLLGAVRHHGFIPWDDDFDVVMPREDFNKFVSIAESQLNDKYFFDWISTNSHYNQFFAKVIMKNTLFESTVYNKGIFVDIFPLDTGPHYSKRLEFHKLIEKKLKGILWYKTQRATSIKTFLFKFAGLFISINRIHKLNNNLLSSLKKCGSSHYSNFVTRYGIRQQTNPKEWYDSGVLLEFEDRSYYAPIKYELILESVFGNNYMVIPPKSKRRCHYPRKVIFSDGIIMEFNIPTHKVTLKDQEDEK